MKVCERCGDMIDTPDAENLCLDCSESKGKARHARRARSDRADVMRSLGLVRVRGALGGVYWE